MYFSFLRLFDLSGLGSNRPGLLWCVRSLLFKQHASNGVGVFLDPGWELDGCFKPFVRCKVQDGLLQTRYHGLRNAIST